jgi:hypothetical protein
MKKLLLASFLLLVPLSLFAQRDPDWRGRDGRRYTSYDSTRTFELTPFGGYRFNGTLYANETSLFGQDVDIANNGNYGVIFSAPISRSGMKLELMVDRQDSHLTTGDGGLFTPDNRIANMHVTYYQAGILIPFYVQNTTPYFVISGGVANLKPDIEGVSADNRFSGSAGFGVKIPFNRNLGLRLEGRGYYTPISNNNNDNCFRCNFDYQNRDLFQAEANVGLTVSF